MFTKTGNALLLAMRQRKESEKKIFVFMLSVCHCVLFRLLLAKKLYVTFLCRLPLSNTYQKHHLCIFLCV